MGQLNTASDNSRRALGICTELEVPFRMFVAAFDIYVRDTKYLTEDDLGDLPGFNLNTVLDPSGLKVLVEAVHKEATGSSDNPNSIDL